MFIHCIITPSTLSFTEIEGAIKTEIRHFQHKTFDIFIGSITDGKHKLEIKIKFDYSSLPPYKKGEQVQVIGIIQKHPPGPPCLQIEKVEHIRQVPKARMPFDKVLKGCKNTLDIPSIIGESVQTIAENSISV